MLRIFKKVTLIVIFSKFNLVVRFSLFLNEEEIEYTPDRNATTIEVPEFLTQSICFDMKELPSFLQQILSIVYRK
jgi:hypothetical protein